MARALSMPTLEGNVDMTTGATEGVPTVYRTRETPALSTRYSWVPAGLGLTVDEGGRAIHIHRTHRRWLRRDGPGEDIPSLGGSEADGGGGVGKEASDRISRVGEGELCQLYDGVDGDGADVTTRLDRGGRCGAR